MGRRTQNFALSFASFVAIAACGASGATKKTSTGGGEGATAGDDVGDASTSNDTGDVTEGWDDRDKGDPAGGGGDQPSPTDAAAPPDGELAGSGAGGNEAAEETDARFKTSKSRTEMSEFLVAPAAEAMKKREYLRAVSLYRGLVKARGVGDPVALELAKAWRLTGEFDNALDVYNAIADTAKDDELRRVARREAEVVRNTPRPFRRETNIEPARKEAGEAFNLGRKAFKAKKYADALFYFELASALDPDMTGPVREIGAAYDKLGAREEATRFDLDYLRRRPFGKLADEVRKRLKKNKKSGELGVLDIVSKIPCQEVWLVGQQYRGKMPAKKLQMAPGVYKGLCFHGEYQMAYFDFVTVEAGKPATLEFRWAVVVNKVEKPFGRIRMEHWARPGVLMDLGLEVKEFGVPVPKDGRQLEVRIQSLAGDKEETQFIKLTSGERVEIKWK